MIFQWKGAQADRSAESLISCVEAAFCGSRCRLCPLLYQARAESERRGSRRHVLRTEPPLHTRPFFHPYLTKDWRRSCGCCFSGENGNGSPESSSHSALKETSPPKVSTHLSRCILLEGASSVLA